MAREIPEVVRAAAGLAATVLDEARKLPETLPGLPVRAIGLALQHAMKVQQQYAGLVARGDEVFTGLRGEDEPGLATFDDDEVPPPAPAPDFRESGFRDSAFDRAGAVPAAADALADAAEEEDLDAATLTEEVRTAEALTEELVPEGAIDDAEVALLPDDPAADAVVDAVEDLAEQVETAQEALDEVPAASPGTDEVLDDLAIAEMVDGAPADLAAAAETEVLEGADATATEDADALENALLEADDAPGQEAAAAEPATDGAASVDVLTPEGDVATVDAAVTDEGVAAPEPAAPEPSAPEPAAEASAPAPATGTDEEPQGGSDLSGSQAAGAAPVEGYDSFSIAQLRGRLRGYAPVTVQELLDYEQATRDRDPYVRMLRNRLERLQADA